LEIDVDTDDNLPIWVVGTDDLLLDRLSKLDRGISAAESAMAEQNVMELCGML